MAIQQNNLKNLTQMLDRRTKVLSTATNNGDMLLNFAVRNGNIEAVRLILNHPGFQPDYMHLKSDDGKTAMDLAIALDHQNIIDLMKEHFNAYKN